MALIKILELKMKYNMNDEKLYHYLSEGMPHYQVNGSIRFSCEEVEQWLSEFINQQQMLEHSFVDSKGRGIDAYTDADGIAELLSVNENEVPLLALKGMPYTVVGKKVFYQPEDVLAYFKIGKTEENKEVLQQQVFNEQNVKNTNKCIKKVELESPEHIIVVDGSHNPTEQKIASGLVWKSPKNTVGYALSFPHKTKYSIYSEWIAILEALKMIEKENLQNVVIATDQKPLLRKLNEKDLWKNVKEETNPELLKIPHEIVTLLSKLEKNNVVFEYAKKEKYVMLYRNAHKLSTLHRNELCYSLVAQTQEVEKTPENKLFVRYVGMQKNKCVVEVKINGIFKRIEENMNCPIKSMLNISRNLTSTLNHVALEIESFPNFEKHMLHSPKDLKWLKEMYQKIKEKCSIIDIESKFEKYLVL